MQKLLGILIIIAGICLGLYLGLYLCFVGGIVAIIEACKETPVPALDVALGLLRVLCTGLVTWLVIFVCGFIGGALCATSKPSRRRW